MAEMERREKLEQQHSYYQNQAKKNQRVADYSLDDENYRIYQHRAKQSQKKADEVAKKLDEAVAKIDNGGIIKEDSKKPITKITDSAIANVPEIKIDGYSLEQCSIIQEQHKELLNYSRKNNEHKEIAFVFRKGLLDRKEYTGEDDVLEFGNGLLGKGDELLVMHNHPRNGSYSVTDLILFRNDSNIKTLTIVKNNGNVEYITKDENFDNQKFKHEFDRPYSKIVLTDTNDEKINL